MDGAPLTAGFFPVEKPGKDGAPSTRDRGIADWRAANAYERLMPLRILPHGTQWCLVVLRDDE
eukprot:15441657-Heterocapsa_arctica.AAC.1